MTKETKPTTSITKETKTIYYSPTWAERSIAWEDTASDTWEQSYSSAYNPSREAKPSASITKETKP